MGDFSDQTCLTVCISAEVLLSYFDFTEWSQSDFSRQEIWFVKEVLYPIQNWYKLTALTDWENKVSLFCQFTIYSFFLTQITPFEFDYLYLDASRF